MARPNYMSVYADEKTQKIFDEFVNIKGVTKTAALTDMLQIYMISQDEKLYMELVKKEMNIESARRMLMERNNISRDNDYIFIKLGISSDTEGNELDGVETMEAYVNNLKNAGNGYTWFSTQSLYFGMSKKKVDAYNDLVEAGEQVTMLFAIGGDINDIVYSATVKKIESNKEQQLCPDDNKTTIPDEFGEDETAKIWVKLSDIREENQLKADMLKVKSTGANLKTIISNSQFHFGYVCLK